MDIYTISTQQNLDLVSRHCPRALSTYTICICHADDDGRAFFSKKTITEELSESYVKFKNNIRKLALEFLLEWHENEAGISITLVLPEDE